jgi:hypothetical protein
MQHGYALYLVKSGDTVWKIARDVYKLQSNSQIAWKVQSILDRNRHIGSGDRIYPGQLLYIDDGNLPVSPDALAEDLDSASKELLMLSPDDQCFISENYELLSIIGHEMADSHHSSYLSQVTTSPSSVASSLGPSFQPLQSTFFKVSKEAFRIAKAGVSGYHKAAFGEFGQLIDIPQHAIYNIEGQLVRSLQNQVRYVRQSNDTLRMIPADARAFQMDGRVFVAQTQSPGFLSLTKSIRDNKDLANKLKTGAKVVGWGLDLGVAAYKTANDWDTDRRYITPAAEAAKIAIKVKAAPAVPAAALGLCTFLSFTTGPGGVVCFVTVAVGASYGMSKVVDWGVDSTADVIYESVRGTPID